MSIIPNKSERHLRPFHHQYKTVPPHISFFLVYDSSPQVERDTIREILSATINQHILTSQSECGIVSLNPQPLAD